MIRFLNSPQVGHEWHEMRVLCRHKGSGVSHGKPRPRDKGAHVCALGQVVVFDGYGYRSGMANGAGWSGHHQFVRFKLFSITLISRFARC
jgi:hypothetical protein